MGEIFGLILAAVFPLLILGIIRKFDFYQTGQFKLILLSLIWGGIVYAPTALINNALKDFWLIDWSIIERFVAPILEEMFKGLVLFYLIRLTQITYSVDGALYGSAVGIGFAIVENLDFVTEPSIAIIVAMQRVLSANLVHASSSAIIGIALGVYRLKRTRSRWLILAFGPFLAIGLHMFYNTINQAGISLATAFVIGILGTVFIYIVMHRGKKQAQDWIRQKLGVGDRVTPGEAAMVDRLDSKQDIFLPVVERFGAEKASQVEKLLYLQARLGIKRKALDSFRDDVPMRNEAQAEIREIQKEIEVRQRAIGAYAMLFVRGLFTEEMVSVWDRMQAKIRERSAATGGQKGGGLWSTLEEHVKPPTDTERLEERLWNKIPPIN